MQSIYQLQEIYGKDAMAVYKAVTGLKIFGTIKGDDEQNFVSGIVGKRTVQRRNVSQSGAGDGKINQSQSWSGHEEIDVFHPTEFEQLGPVAFGRDNSQKFIRGLIVGHGKDALILEWPLFIAKEYRDANGELLTNKALRESKETQVLAQPTVSEAELQPSAGRVPPDTHSLEIRPAEPVQAQLQPEPDVDRETIEPATTTTLDMFPDQPTVPNEYTEKSEINEVANEVLEEIANSVATEAIAETTGIPSEAIELVENLADIAYQKQDNEPLQIESVSTGKRKSRKPRKYVYES